MIHFCNCAGGSASKIEHPMHREVTKTCMICGGNPLVDGRGSLSRSMMSTVGLELSRVVDPHLNWKTATKGKPRAVRRARTSFTGGIKKKPSEKGLNDSVNCDDKASKRTEEMLVSESEKLGVSILGRRFSDAFESVPIKKRRFLLAQSLSPPTCSQSLFDESKHIPAIQSTSHQREAAISLITRQKLPKNDTSGGTVLDEARTVTDRNSNFEDIDKLCDTADFSGISILAAAACNSSDGDDAVNAESSVSKGHSFEREGSVGISEHSGSNIMLENKNCVERIFNTAWALDNKYDVQLVSTSALMSTSKRQDDNKIEGSDIPKDSSSSLLNINNKANGNSGRAKKSSRDNRLHWDLNTVMDAWESPDDISADPQPLAANIPCVDGIHDAKLDNKEVCKGQIELSDIKSAAELLDHKVVLGSVPTYDCKDIQTNQVKADFQGNCSVMDRGAGAGGDSQEEQQLGVPPVCVPDFPEEAKTVDSQVLSVFTADAVHSPVRHAPDSVEGSHLPTACAVEEKSDFHSAGFNCNMETKTIPCPLFSEKASIEQPVHACELSSPVNQLASGTVSEDKASEGSKADVDKHSVGCGLTDVQMGETLHIGTEQYEKHVHFHADSEACKISDTSDGTVPGQVSGVVVDGDICRKIAGDGEMGGDVGQTKLFEEERPIAISQSKEADESSCPSDLAFRMQGLPTSEENASECLNNDERTASKVKFQSATSFISSDQNLHGTEIDGHNHIGSNGSITPSAVDVCLQVDASSYHDTHTNYVDDIVSSHVENALDEHFSCDYDSDASLNDTDRAVGMEKIDLQEGDDSQYEDGEFRGWGLDEGEEGEAERVDYESEDRDIDAFEAASDNLKFTISLHADNIECKKDGPLEDGQVHPGEDHGKKDVQEAVPTLLSVTNDSETGTSKIRAVNIMKRVPRGGHSRRKNVSENLEGDMKEASEFGAVTEFLAEGDNAGLSSHSASLRMKLSGWDRLPEGRRSYEDVVVDAGAGVGNNAERSHASVSADVLSAGESLRKVGGSMLRRDLSSRIERPESSDVSDRKDRAYLRGNRSDDQPSDLHHSGERDVVSGRPIRRGGSSVRLHGRGRGGDRWVGTSSHWGRSRHDSPGYYGPAGFTHHGSGDAAAASTAKVKSNGFVVAPDGTVVEAGGVGHVGQLSRPSANASFQSSRPLPRRGSPTDRDEVLAFATPLGLRPMREMSPDRRINRGRTGRYGPRIASGHRERYRGFMLDESVGSSLAMQHPFSRRERSFSPRRRPVNVSRPHTSSPSRSITRSPRGWISPRGRTDNGINGSLWRRSRSPPNFRSEARIERMKSPHRRSGFPDRMTGFASRSQASPPHASRWIDERKEHFRQQQYKKSSERSPPVRLFSRSQRFDPMDSPGRLKSDEYHRPMHSGRFHEFGVGKGHRIGARDDDRRRGDRYEVLPSLRQYDIVGNVNRFRYDADDDFRTHNPRSKNAPEFHRRGSPRGFDRGIQSQLCDSPPRSRGDKGHFRYGREGKNNASFKSFGMRECDEDSTPRRRRPS